MHRESNKNNTSQEHIQEKHIQEMLTPLQNALSHVEYKHQLKIATELNQRFRSLEALYTNIYTRATALETKKL